MYLSKVLLDISRRETMRAMSAPQRIHGAIQSGFEGERERCLWRIDKLSDTYALLVLSERHPNLTNVIQQFGAPEAEAHSKDYSPMIERIREGQTWHFRIKANPVHNELKGPDTRGKVYGHQTPAQQMRWLMERSEKNGFILSEDGFQVVDMGWIRFKKGGEPNRQVTIRTATFEGLLTVCHRESFIRTLTHGLGRGKAYGCGLLTVVGADKL